MTREEAIKSLKIIASYEDTLGYLEEHSVTVQDALYMAIKALEQEPTSPCDVCRYNPPSSTDGKPCTMCPACRK